MGPTKRGVVRKLQRGDYLFAGKDRKFVPVYVPNLFRPLSLLRLWDFLRRVEKKNGQVAVMLLRLVGIGIELLERSGYRGSHTLSPPIGCEKGCCVRVEAEIVVAFGSDELGPPQ